MIVTPEQVKAYAHCRNAMCPGYGQQQVDAVRTTVAYTYGDNGADMFKSMVERSVQTIDFASPDDVPCPHCGQARDVTDQERPSYQPLSGHDPMGLVNGGHVFDPNRVNTQQDAEIAELRAELARLASKLGGEDA